MAKKVKRTTSSGKAKVETPARTTAATSTRTSNAEFNPDYGYVIKDLKRIGVLAGSFFVILIALAIFLA
ncbi:MAG: hypothetical protein ACYC6H_07575 [Bellilinea sp.]